MAASVTIALDTTGDLAITERRLLVPVRDLGTVTALRIRNKLLLIQGTWFLDLRLGFTWTKIHGQKALPPAVIETSFRDYILATPGVVRVPRCEARIERPTRKLFIDFQAVAGDGSIITGFENLAVNGASAYVSTGLAVDPASLGFSLGGVSI